MSLNRVQSARNHLLFAVNFGGRPAYFIFPSVNHKAPRPYTSGRLEKVIFAVNHNYSGNIGLSLTIRSALVDMMVRTFSDVGR